MYFSSEDDFVKKKKYLKFFIFIVDPYFYMYEKKNA